MTRIIGSSVLEGEFEPSQRTLQLDVEPDGSHLALKAEFADFGDAFVRLAVQPGVVESIPLCSPSGATLLPLEPLTIGDTAAVLMAGSQSENAIPAVAVSLGLATSSGCGVAVPGIGEISIDVGAGLLAFDFLGSSLLGGLPPELPWSVPPDLALLGAELFVRGLWLDASGPEPLRPTGAVRYAIGS